MMSSFTCITCRVMFVDGATQRAHYKTDWHRYNLKRKVIDIPAVSAENFQTRVLNAQNKQVETDKTELFCKPCRKQFNSSKALENHLQSKKHKEIEGKFAEKEISQAGQVQTKHKPTTNSDIDMGNAEEMEEAETDSDVESVDSFGSEDGLGIEECLFCSHISPSMEDSLQHMSVKHSFFIPDAEFVSDLEGLITYLGKKVGQGYMCLWCNEKGKVFQSAQSAQKHMMDKGHCKMLHEGDVLLEYADFYDYRSSYPDYDPASATSAEEDMEVDTGDVDLERDGFELVLPSGSTVGHRALAKYYRQNINPRSADRTRSVLPKMLAQYKALGWTGTSGHDAERRCRDLGAVQRFKKQHFMKLGVKGNTNLRHRYRNSNPI